MTPVRACYIRPSMLCPIADIAAVFEHCAALGFDTVVLPCPFVRDGAWAGARIADPERLAAVFDWPGGADEGLARLVATASEHGLRLMLDVRLDEVESDAPIVAQQPDRFRPRRGSDGRPPDPRRPVENPASAIARFGDSPGAGALADWWADRLGQWCAAGIVGFRCLWPQRVPPARWQSIIERVHARGDRGARGARTRDKARFWAWTPGLKPDETVALAGCGFDAAFSSLPWWDFRENWYLREDARLRRFAAVVAPVTDPLQPIQAADTGDDPEAQRRIRLRAIEFAAATGDGALVPLDSHNDSDPVVDAAIADANRMLASRGSTRRGGLRPLLVAADTPATALLVEQSGGGGDADECRLVLVNADNQHVATVDVHELRRNAGEFSVFRSHPSQDAAAGGAESAVNPDTDLLDALALEPAEVRSYTASRAAPITLGEKAQPQVGKAAAAPRVAIEHVTPSVDGGRFAAKRVVGERVVVQADVFCDGHDLVAAAVLWRAAGTRRWQRAPMRDLGNDRWCGEFALDRVGRHEFTVEAWRDEFATARMDLEKKRAAGKLSTVDIDEVCQLVSNAAAPVARVTPDSMRGQPGQRGSMEERGSPGAVDGLTRATGRVTDAAAGDGQASSNAPALAALARQLQDAADDDSRAALLVSPDAAQAMARADHRPFLTRHPTVFPIDAERRAAGYGSWYELFPRSQSTPDEHGVQAHGTFDDVIPRLPAIRDMGFDVLYMPPIHPIGRINRKGRNNAVTAQAGEPGSPYAIGAKEGGHDAIHPEIGTLEDFRRLVAAAADHGLEVALDFAIQCSPDHPWLREHPDWFAWRADGSIRYAENPPKKYEDIVNVDFYAEGAVPDLWLALRDVVAFWVDQGVRLFRVDNPHTKPYPFWEWLIADIRGRDPGVAFLAEAFTRPKVMYRLAKLGFSQSYTYFTWRNGKQELTDYLEELAQGEPSDYFRPHFFVNTPDINPVFLQTSGRAGHLIRAALATTLSGLWGMYSGFELCEATVLAPGKEEYLDSEKYQLRAWDWQRPGNIIDEITRLNLLRRLHPALQTHLGITFYNAFNDQVLYYGKRHGTAGEMILVAVNLDPHHAQEADFEAPLWEWGLPDHASLQVEDLWRGTRHVWHGKLQHLRLDPGELPFAIWRVGPGVAA